jgi:hypothetical protein
MWRTLTNGEPASSWQIRRTGGAGDVLWGVEMPSANTDIVLWAEGLSPYEFQYSDQGGGGSPSTISLFYAGGGGLYEPIPGSAGFENIREIPGIPGVYYVFARRFTGSGPLGLFGVFSPGAGFTARATFADDNLGPVAIMPNDSQRLASFGRTGASGARIMRSADGGYSWYDATGDWATQIGAIGDGSSYKSIAFAFTV